MQKYGEDAIRGLKTSNWIVRILMALVVGTGLYVGLPYAVSIVEQLFQVAIGLSKIALIGIPLFGALSFLWANRTLFREMRERWSRKLWQNFIYNDPLDYIEGVMNDFVKADSLMKQAIAKLRGIMQKLKERALRLIDAYNKGIQMAKAYDEEGDEQEADLQAYYAESSAQSAADIERMYLETQESVFLLEELQKSLSNDIKIMRFDLEMMRDDLEIAELKGEIATIMQKAMHGGNVDEIARREYAKFAYRDKVAKFKGKFDQFLSDIEPILKAKRIEKVIQTKEGRKALEAFRTNKDDFGGLKTFGQEIERLKRENPNQYKSNSPVDVKKYTKRGVDRSSSGNRSSFANLK